MLLIEIIFFMITIMFLIFLFSDRLGKVISKEYFLWAISAALLFSIILSIYRWQMIPVYVAVGVLFLASFKTKPHRWWGRILCGIPVLLLLSLSILLTNLMPIVSLPKPTGMLAIGTFDYVLTDTSRNEAYSPTEHRNVYVRVWYPADSEQVADFPLLAYGSDLNSGNLDPISFLTSYLKLIDSNSHVLAPAAVTSEKFPVLIYNHGGNGWTGMNTLLVEHLASHGYIILSIGHPYGSARVPLPGRNAILESFQPPPGTNLTQQQLVGMNTIGRALGALGEKTSVVASALNSLIDEVSNIPGEAEKLLVIDREMNSENLHPLGDALTQNNLYAYVLANALYMRPSIETWVLDTKFVADSFYETQFPIDGFEQIINKQGFGVFGLSRGGAVATAFCKIDSRCLAGANMDGIPLGINWKPPVPVPFLLITSESNQNRYDFAYLPNIAEHVEYSISNSLHLDFTDFTYVVSPLFKLVGMAGSIEGERIIEISNTLHLEFFDKHLKGNANINDYSKRFPELIKGKGKNE